MEMETTVLIVPSDNYIEDRIDRLRNAISTQFLMNSPSLNGGMRLMPSPRPHITTGRYSS